MRSFLNAVRSRKHADLTAEALEGHRSTACCHLANISYRIGRQAQPQAIEEQLRSNAELLDAYQRCREHLRVNGIDLEKVPAVLGPWVTFDTQHERFTGEFAKEASAYLRRKTYRKPFEVPRV
jgi:hypothetical protein